MLNHLPTHMSSEAFRAHGHAVIDWIADYYDRIESYPVLSPAKPGEIRASLPERPPEAGEPFDRMLADVDEKLMPGITHWQSPHFYAFFPANASGPGILGDLLASGLGVQGMIWATSPACTELETLMMDWLVDLLGLPTSFTSSGAGGGVIQDTASSAVLCALLAGRERATSYASNERGIDGRLTVYTSAHAHSSVEKAAKIAGIGRANVRLVEVDDAFAMRPEALEARIFEDRKAGLTPCFVCATVGTTSSLAFDPLPAIGSICRREGIWLHVDAAMAGTAALCPEFRWIHDGLEAADSYCFNPHKWMLTNFDCSAFFVRDRKALIDTFSILPEYLRNAATASGEVIDYRDWHVQLGRRFRSLKLWFVIRHYGAEGLRAFVRAHVAAAQALVGWIRDDAEFELAAPAPLNLVCFRSRRGDAVNQALLEALNASGRLYLTQTRLSGRLTLRLCIGQARTTLAHIGETWQRIRETAATL
jgi:aromatic-L-amino-acid decarboxylase